jgi:peptidoglycan-N-acetylglucosamine deacetylase
MSGEPSRVGVSRRTLLRATQIAVAAGLVAGGAAAAGSARPQVRARAFSRLPPPVPTGPPASAAPAAPSIASMPAQGKPIYTLAEYRALVPGPAFPANAVALTIDDGPHPTWTPLILRLLDKYHVRATFCLIGVETRGHQPVARSLASAGHHIANHTWSHPLTIQRQPAAQMRQQISQAQDAIATITGYTPRLFRSPGGAWSPALSTQTAEAGLVAIDWSDDPRDWSRPGIPAITTRLLAVRPGQILLCHDGGGDRSQTYASLQVVIPALLARGYTFVTL